MQATRSDFCQSFWSAIRLGEYLEMQSTTETRLFVPRLVQTGVKSRAGRWRALHRRHRDGLPLRPAA